MMTDPISDLLAQVKNGYMARKSLVVVSHSKLKTELAKLLSREGYLGKVQIQSNGKVKKNISVELVYKDKQPKLTDILRVSKISRRIYVKKNAIPKVLSGLGISIISTPNGLMTDSEAKKKRIGGEIICKLW